MFRSARGAEGAIDEIGRWADSLPGEFAIEDGEAPVWDALGVLDWVFVPHVDTPGHPETEACGRFAMRCAEAQLPARTFRDGEVLVVDGNHEHLCT